MGDEEYDSRTDMDIAQSLDESDLVRALKERGYTVWHSSTPNEPIPFTPGLNPLDPAQQGKSYTLDEFIAEVTRVAKVELLRELAAELDNPMEHLHCVANAKDTPQDFRGYLVKSIRERAEFLEASGRTEGG